jgi:hypothetical protein
MAWSALTPCRCGHVANHHGGPENDCHIAGCPCRSFKADADSVPLGQHNAVVAKANRIIRKQRETIAGLRSELKEKGQ